MDTAEATVEVESSETPAEESPAVETETREAPVVERTSRADRKRQRIDVEAATREKEEYKQRLAAAEARDQQRAQEIAELRGRMMERDKSSEKTDKHAGTKTKIAELKRLAKGQLIMSAQAPQGSEAAQKYWDEYERLQDEANDLRADMRGEDQWEKRRGELTADMPNPEAQREYGHIMSRFPWLENDGEAQALVVGRVNALVASGKVPRGRQYARETVTEAITWVAKALQRGGNQAPSAGQRALYGGVSSGEGPGGGDERPRVPPLNRDTEALARAAYPHLEAKQAYKQWQKDMTARENDDE